MRRRPDHTLRQELLAAGASETEAQDLKDLAMQLSRLKPGSDKARNRGWKLAVPLSIAAGVAIVLLIVTLANGSLPGNPLYPVQRTSDSVAIALHPSYRASVMMRQAEQVRVLVETHAPSSEVMTALNEYQHQATIYRTHYANYRVFENCKNSLQQAANHAAGPDRQAIDQTLAGLQDV